MEAIEKIQYHHRFWSHLSNHPSFTAHGRPNPLSWTAQIWLRPQEGNVIPNAVLKLNKFRVYELHIH